VLAGCKTVARGEIYEEMIEVRLRELGHETEVDCPDAIPLGLVVDNHFECVVSERGGETPVIVQLGASYDAWKLEAK
jgi:hypothetical protein